MWAALAGLGTLLQGPVVGAFVGHETHEEWIVDRGAARTAGGKAIVDLQLPPEPPFGGPVAVLVGPHTAGAGEAVAVAFEGRPRTRFFGAPTQGRDDAAIVAHTLSDGTVLGVVGARNADRNGVVYRGPIEPDKVLAPDDGQALPHEALEWVQEQR
jgi:carboxyl-terminal processing protease